MDPDIKFTAPLDALGTPFGHQGPSSVHLVFSFNVLTTNQLPLIKDNSLLINSWTFDAGPDAFIQITENVLDSASNPLGDQLRAVHRFKLAGGAPAGKWDRHRDAALV
ncbi:MAG: hypothetical protein HYX69_16175 [Planctomycetia bacterium]|nr:hypothetical protein [Planctomycetia bacterium]